MFDSTMRVGDLVVATYKDLHRVPSGPGMRYYGLLVVRPRWGAISVVCFGDGQKRKFDPRSWDVEVLNHASDR